MTEEKQHIESITERLVRPAPCIPGFYPVTAMAPDHNVTVYRDSAKAAEAWCKRRAATGRYDKFLVQGYNHRLDVFDLKLKPEGTFDTKLAYRKRLPRVWESKLAVDRARFDDLVRKHEGAGYQRSAYFDAHYYSSAAESSNMVTLLKHCIGNDRADRNQEHIVLYSEPDTRGMIYRMYVDWLGTCDLARDSYLDMFPGFKEGSPSDVDEWKSILVDYVVGERAPVWNGSLRESIRMSHARARADDAYKMYQDLKLHQKLAFWRQLLAEDGENLVATFADKPDRLWIVKTAKSKWLAPFIGDPDTPV